MKCFGTTVFSTVHVADSPGSYLLTFYSWNLGIFICEKVGTGKTDLPTYVLLRLTRLFRFIQCAAIHRKLGTYVPFLDT